VVVALASEKPLPSRGDEGSIWRWGRRSAMGGPAWVRRPTKDRHGGGGAGLGWEGWRWVRVYARDCDYCRSLYFESEQNDTRVEDRWAVSPRSAGRLPNRFMF
jgi:hypothetical protein